MAISILNTPKQNTPRNRPIDEAVPRQVRGKRKTVNNSQVLRGPWLYVLILLCGGALLGAASIYQDQLVCKSISITADNGAEKSLLGEEDIKSSLGLTATDALVGVPLGSIDFKNLEQKLRAHPSVAEGQVFHRLNGTIYVEAETRKAIARISGEDGSFYVDTAGRKFPLSQHYAPNVPLVRGVIQETMEPVDTLGCVLEELMPVIAFVHNHPFWQAQISEIRRMDNGDIMLTPEVGDIQMLLGDSYRLDDKFDRLFRFYQQVVKKQGWDRYRQVSVKYRGQVIAKKR